VPSLRTLEVIAQGFELTLFPERFRRAVWKRPCLTWHMPARMLRSIVAFFPRANHLYGIPTPLAGHSGFVSRGAI